ncbi:MAG: D-arabinono-1,4-lactone oxidase [Propionibacteriaceae bacterium]|nr:D-arabinono-1,4-lactone oxidase [Propionibacteriaceae bacterium]
MRWRNWSGSVRCEPTEVAYPASEAGAALVLRRAREQGRTVRPVGAGHSFTPLVATGEVLLSLDQLTGLVRVDGEEATFWAGTRIRDVAGLLAPHGLALPNMGDIDTQSLAGAISTSTHGTGLGFTGYSGMVTGLRLALPDGSVRSVGFDTPDAARSSQSGGSTSGAVEPARPLPLVEPASSTSGVETPGDADHLFHAARVGLGVMGVITQVTLRCVPAFNLECTETTEPIEHVLESYVERARVADHLEFFWFPGTRRATVKELRRLPADGAVRPMTRTDRILNREILGNGVFEAMNAAATGVPVLSGPVREVSSRLMAGRSFSDASHRVYVAPRRVRFHESEYAMPLAAFRRVVREVERAVVVSGEGVTCPLEVRTAAADDTWLGTASGRESIYLAVHRYHRQRFAPVVAAVEPVFGAYEGRPHWGKEHTLTADRLAQLYPRFDDFRRARAAVDPDGVLLNAHTRALLNAG